MSNDTQGKGNNEGSVERNTSRANENRGSSGSTSGGNGSGGSSSGSSQTRNNTGDRVAGILNGKS